VRDGICDEADIARCGCTVKIVVGDCIRCEQNENRLTCMILVGGEYDVALLVVWETNDGTRKADGIKGSLRASDI
jgi:hypothetical protein